MRSKQELCENDSFCIFDNLTRLRGEEKRIWLGVLSLAHALSAPESSGDAIGAVHLVAAFVLCIPTFILSASRTTETGESFNYLLALSPYLTAVFLSTLHHVLHPIDDIYEQFEAVLQGTKLYDKEGHTTGDSIKHSVEAAYL